MTVHDDVAHQKRCRKFPSVWPIFFSSPWSLAPLSPGSMPATWPRRLLAPAAGEAAWKLPGGRWAAAGLPPGRRRGATWARGRRVGWRKRGDQEGVQGLGCGSSRQKVGGFGNELGFKIKGLRVGS